MGFNQSVEEGLEIRKKRLRYQAWHCGMRELDLILGTYVERNIGELSIADMDALEALFHVPAGVLYRWIAGQEPMSAEHDTVILRKIIASVALPGGK